MLAIVTPFIQKLSAHPLWTLAMLAILLFVVALLLRPREDQYQAKPLLTTNEQEFFRRLTKALPDCYIFPQVALRAFVRPGVPSADRAYGRQLGRLGAKHCDFLICDQSLQILAIIELDDRTHIAEKDRQRDAMTGSAGYVTLRYESRIRPSIAEIRDDMARIAASAT